MPKPPATVEYVTIHKICFGFFFTAMKLPVAECLGHCTALMVKASATQTVFKTSEVDKVLF